MQSCLYDIFQNDKGDNLIGIFNYLDKMYLILMIWMWSVSLAEAVECYLVFWKEATTGQRVNDNDVIK